MFQPRFPNQTPNTTGGGYVAGDIPLPQAQPMQQQAAARPTAGTHGTPWSFGAIGDIQQTTGGNELSMQVRKEVGELEGFVQRMHADGVDVTRPDPHDPVAMEAHRYFVDKQWRLRNLTAELQQARGHEKAYLEGVGSGKLLPSSRLNAAMPFDAQQFQRVAVNQNVHPDVVEYQKRHAAYMTQAGQGNLSPELRDMATNDYNRTLASIQAYAQQTGADQGWVQTQMSRVPPPPTSSSTKRKVETTEQTQSGYHQQYIAPRAGAGGAGGSGENSAIGDALMAASIATGRETTGQTGPFWGGETGAPYAQSHNFMRERKLGNGAGAATILRAERHPVTGKVGWVVQTPVEKRGVTTQGAERFVEWQRDPLTGQPDILAELKKTMHAQQYKDMLKALVANGYVHMDRNGRPTEIANLDALMQAMGDERQPTDNAPQDQPQQNDNAAPFSF